MFENITPESIKADILAELTDWNVQSGSYANTLVSGAALEIWKVYAAMNALVPMFYVDETSGEYIDKKCGEYGITRKAGSKATVSLELSGNVGITVQRNSVFVTADGLEFFTNAVVTLDANGAGTVTATAAEVGTAYNVDSAAIVSPKVAVAGLTSVTNAAAASGGVDTESDAALVARLYAFLREPATSGNIYHYKQWALSVTGVGHAKVMPTWNGAGTVKVLLAGADGKAVTDAVKNAVADYIETQRPIGATVTVLSATELTVNVAATVTVDSSTTEATAEAAFAAAVDDYLKSLIFTSYTVNYNHIAYLLMSIPGVTDYSACTVNGGTVNVAVGADQIPVTGTVEVD